MNQNDCLNEDSLNPMMVGNVLFNNTFLIELCHPTHGYMVDGDGHIARKRTCCCHYSTHSI